MIEKEELRLMAHPCRSLAVIIGKEFVTKTKGTCHFWHTGPCKKLANGKCTDKDCIYTHVKNKAHAAAEQSPTDKDKAKKAKAKKKKLAKARAAVAHLEQSSEEE
jgi:hypothetical protein